MRKSAINRKVRKALEVSEEFNKEKLKTLADKKAGLAMRESEINRKVRKATKVSEEFNKEKLKTLADKKAELEMRKSEINRKVRKATKVSKKFNKKKIKTLADLNQYSENDSFSGKIDIVLDENIIIHCKSAGAVNLHS
ncbi:hypothetical protein [Enterococcus mediterraneensis]|uniref:hypothetical protein n=1 Tax=Enterococcus mediterraneensis TaxID=2364791 RepID=UPI000F047F5A|nr:hypothetical protein [Enterococcus mediterraneensis]